MVWICFWQVPRITAIHDCVSLNAGTDLSWGGGAAHEKALLFPAHPSWGIALCCGTQGLASSPTAWFCDEILLRYRHTPLRIVYSNSHATTAELSAYDTNGMAYKGKNLCYLAICWESLPPPILPIFLSLVWIQQRTLEDKQLQMTVLPLRWHFLPRFLFLVILHSLVINPMSSSRLHLLWS